jgi:hypothetical protein
MRWPGCLLLHHAYKNQLDTWSSWSRMYQLLLHLHPLGDFFLSMVNNNLDTPLIWVSELPWPASQFDCVTASCLCIYIDWSIRWSCTDTFLPSFYATFLLHHSQSSHGSLSASSDQ